ncbi:hypothetical protein IU449_26850 [Nocardia higoensis]|uniref:Uncharacterized protein n=1 Tax=Nocardia higoensis TaxID=228599 RepID=A0ABS0DI34_9NOCA|nr:hypothetical protein [Nocardia higoensis]MBF6358119.1 hypothetical protein [Nocardia higoensis]
MTEKTGLEWLTVGATVAYICNSRLSSRVREAVVDRIGKRDVVVLVDGDEGRFNITRTRARGETAWLHEYGDGLSGRSWDLAPLDHPEVLVIKAAQKRRAVTTSVGHAADKFKNRGDVESAKALRDAVDAFLKLAEPDDQP